MIAGVAEHGRLVGKEEKGIDKVVAAAEIGVESVQPIHQQAQQQPVVLREIAVIEAVGFVR